MEALKMESNPFDLGEMQNFARWCFQLTRRDGSSPAGDRVSKNAKGNMLLKPCSKMWSRQIAAKETDRAQFSRELIHPEDFGKSRYVHLLHTLSHPDIAIIKAMHHGSPSQRDHYRGGIIGVVMADSAGRSMKARIFMAQIADTAIRRRSFSTPWEWDFIAMDKKTWDSSYVRDLFKDVKRDIRAMEEKALQAWWAKINADCK